ncbi:uncharacterized protein LOC126899689 [Daktulosphaira vitifoliae]|uniref:uncharacterized protein LOC126899689 n=1 Tax=Daktulosphaira vitifoliae TaxID=58002 RepID=UPI0021A9F84D|nr:uncharacterized protein LOC126899689 [Daktulosphaira vitifoliae]
MMKPLHCIIIIILFLNVLSKSQASYSQPKLQLLNCLVKSNVHMYVVDKDDNNLFTEKFLNELKLWKKEILLHKNNRYSLRALKSFGSIGHKMSDCVCSNYEQSQILKQEHRNTSEICKEKVLDCCNEYANNVMKKSKILKIIENFLKFFMWY